MSSVSAYRRPDGKLDFYKIGLWLMLVIFVFYALNLHVFGFSLPF